MTSYLLHQSHFSEFGVVRVACIQRNLFSLVQVREGCQAAINLLRVRAEARLWYIPRGKECTSGPRNHQGLLVQEDRAASASLWLPLTGVSQGEELNLFSDGDIFISLQECCPFPQECVYKGSQNHRIS